MQNSGATNIVMFVDEGQPVGTNTNHHDHLTLQGHQYDRDNPPTPITDPAL